MNNLWKDIRYAVRVLGKSPGFTAVVVLSLALGIGANTAIFNLFDAFLLRPMPVDAPDRLVAMYASSPAVQAEGMSYPELLDLRKQDTGLSDLLGFTGYPLSVTDGERPEVIWAEVVTGNYFSALGVHPALGRGFRSVADCCRRDGRLLRETPGRAAAGFRLRAAHARRRGKGSTRH